MSVSPRRESAATHSSGSGRSALVRNLASLALVAALCVLALLLRPTVFTLPRFFQSDSGVFYAVFERLVRGERLYTDVFDHKDPLFYVFYTAAYAVVGDLGPMVWETILTLLGLALVVLIARRLAFGLFAQMLVALAFFLYFLHPASYFPVHTNHQAIVIALVALALGLARRDLLAGAAIGAMILTKLPLALYAPSLALIALAGTSPSFGRPTLVRVARMAAAALAVVLLGVLALMLSGALPGYVDVLDVNIRYQAQYGLIRDAYWDYTPRSPLVAIARSLSPLLLAAHVLLLVAGAASVVWPGRSAEQGARWRALALLLAALGAIAATAVILASGYAWLHYYQILCLPVLASALCGLYLNQHWLTSGWRGPVALALYAALAVASGALSAEPSYVGLQEAQRDADRYESELRPCIVDSFRDTASSTFATLGSNDAVQVARLTPPGSRLACRAFYQFPWFHGVILDGLVSCLERQPPDLVFQRRVHFPIDVGDQIDGALRRNYMRETSCSGVTVWRRR